FQSLRAQSEPLLWCTLQSSQFSDEIVGCHRTIPARSILLADAMCQGVVIRAEDHQVLLAVRAAASQRHDVMGVQEIQSPSDSNRWWRHPLAHSAAHLSSFGVSRFE